MRYSETEASKEFIIPNTVTGKLFRSSPSFLGRLILKVRTIFNRSVARIVSTFFLITVFSWFSINTENVATGFVEIFQGDLGGIRTILKTPNITGIFSEAYQVGIGKDYTWLEYKKETGRDLAPDFVYVGKKQSLTKHLITIKQITKFEDNFEDSCFSELPDGSKEYTKVCDEPATVIKKEDAEEFCKKVYGAKVANYYELRDILGVANPVTRLKIKEYESYHEMTSSLNPEDDDEYRVFYKTKKAENLPKYIDDESSISPFVGFRCFIRL